MPTLYDNFSQIRQYIDENAGQADLSSYVTKTELANASYVTSSDLNDYPTYTYVSDNFLSLHGDRVMDGTLTLSNSVPAILGTERSWKIYEGGTGSGAYIALQANVDSKYFYIRDNAGNNLIQIYESSNNTAKSAITNFTVNTYTNNILPRTNSTYNIGSSTARFASTYTDVAYITNNNKMRDVTNAGWYFSRNNTDIFKVMAGGSNIGISPSSNNSRYLGSSEEQWAYTYTRNLILNGTDINQPLSKGIWHIGTCTTYTNETTAYCTATVDNFELDSNNNNPLVGTIIAIKVTSVNQSKNGAAMKLDVNGTGQKPLYCQTGERTSTTRSWFYDMNVVGRWYYWMWDGTYWVWINVGQEQDSTYSAMSDSEMSTGTATNSRTVTAKSLATYYVSKSFLSSCGYLTSVPSEYITQAELSACSYAVDPGTSIGTWNSINPSNPYYSTAQMIKPSFVYTYLPNKDMINAMFSYDTTTGTLTITTL